jgi:hypothetical protein
LVNPVDIAISASGRPRTAINLLGRADTLAKQPLIWRHADGREPFAGPPQMPIQIRDDSSIVIAGLENRVQ